MVKQYLSPAGAISGKNGRVEIIDLEYSAANSSPLTATIKRKSQLLATKYHIEFKVEEIDISTFETAPFKNFMPGMYEADAQIEAFWDPAATPFDTPPDLRIGRECSLNLYTNLSDDSAINFSFLNVLICELSVDCNVRDLIKYTFRARIRGWFQHAYFLANATASRPAFQPPSSFERLPPNYDTASALKPT